MTINPLIPHVPAFVSYLVYGFMTGALFRFGRRGGRGCLFAIIFWYAFTVGVLFFFGMLSVTSRADQLCFAVGVLLPYARILWESDSVQAPLSILSDIAHFLHRITMQAWHTWKDWQERRQPTNPTSSKTYTHDRARTQENQNRSQDTYQEAMRQEQAKREAEARAKREQAERERQRQEKERQNQNRQQRTEPPETRTPEEILGLKPPWTQEDLRTAYKREAGRTHPDKWIGKPEAIRQLMEAEYKAIQEAYRILNRP